MKVKFFATLRAIVGGKEVEIPLQGTITARQLFDQILETYPALRPELLDDDGNMHGHVHFFINGRDIQFHEDAWSRPIEPEDTVTVFPAIGGG